MLLTQKEMLVGCSTGSEEDSPSDYFQGSLVAWSDLLKEHFRLEKMVQGKVLRGKNKGKPGASLTQRATASMPWSVVERQLIKGQK